MHFVDLYSGSSQDWVREYAKVKYSYTIELRDEGDRKFLLPPDEILPTCEETWEAVKVVARYLNDIRNSDKITLLSSLNDSTASPFRPPPFRVIRSTTPKDEDYDDESNQSYDTEEDDDKE